MIFEETLGDIKAMLRLHQMRFNNLNERMGEPADWTTPDKKVSRENLVKSLNRLKSFASKHDKVLKMLADYLKKTDKIDAPLIQEGRQTKTASDIVTIIDILRSYLRDLQSQTEQDIRYASNNNDKNIPNVLETLNLILNTIQTIENTAREDILWVNSAITRISQNSDRSAKRVVEELEQVAKDMMIVEK